MRRTTLAFLLGSLLLSRSEAIAGEVPKSSLAPVPPMEPAPALPRADAFARLPIREVTVFKDGHAFVLHEGEMPVEADGTVRLDYLPTPIFGAFWPYSPDPDVKIASVTAGRHRVAVRRTALTLREILEANPGAEAVVSERVDEKTTLKYPATILGVPERSGRELAETSPPGAEERLPEKGSVVLLRTAEGTKAVPLDRVLDVTLKKDPERKAAAEEFRNLLTVRLDFGKKGRGKTARIGLAYVQKGVRWIPNYRVSLDGKGEAIVTLQATVLNELCELESASVHLVVGVPTFEFKDQTDPMALQQQMARLSTYFEPDARSANFLSNAAMTQVAYTNTRRIEAPSPPPAAGDLGPALPEGGKREDLYVFSLKGVTMRKGERMALPVAESKARYGNLFTLSLPFAPPAEVRRRWGEGQQSEIARLLALPKAMHVIRLENAGPHPFTTAPAVILAGDKILAQSLMTYTPKGAAVDLKTTTAVDILVSRSDKETGRAANAYEWDHHRFARIDLAGTIRLTNRRGEAVDLEVTRRVIGEVDSAEPKGKSVKESGLESEDWAAVADLPPWWYWYSWPYWWHHVNGISRITWKVKLAPDKETTLDYAWHYYWD